MKRTINAITGALATGSVGLALFVTGCGGGSDSGTPSKTTSGAVTSRSEGNYSQDALILAAKRSQDVLISADEAKQIDADLTKIRAAVPAVKDVHAFSDFELHTVIADVKPGVAYIPAWRQGTLATGDAALDAVLTQYHVTRVEPFVSGEATTFTLKFEDPLNIPALTAQMNKVSSSFKTLSRSLYAGDGDRIALSVTADKREYAFSRGWGDCPAGCIARHIWAVTLDAAGVVTVKESGPTPPQETTVTP